MARRNRTTQFPAGECDVYVLHCRLCSPRLFRRKYFYYVWFSRKLFCQWTPGQTKRVHYGQYRKIRNKQGSRVQSKCRYIPAAYIRLLHQLHNESRCGTDSLIYEAQRRASYAGRVLDAFGEELELYPELEDDGPEAKAWRSAVLTPILQRQIYGIPDTVTSWVHEGILCALVDPSADDGSNNNNENVGEDDNTVLTIAHATRFYLSSDPVDPDVIPILRRNLVLTREMRWHLAITLNKFSVDDMEFFVTTVENQDRLLECPAPNEILMDIPESNRTSVPAFSPLETEIILREKLREFFDELNNIVCIESVP